LSTDAIWAREHFVKEEKAMEEKAPSKLLLRVPRAAELADVSRAEGYNLVARGEWPHVRIGAKGTGVRVVYADLIEWIERQKRHGYGAATTDRAA
jgi:predicted DNA-binding transcriptional regulator AlpA